MKKRTQPKICTVGANCKSTCISGSYNCLKVKGSQVIKDAFVKIGSLKLTPYSIGNLSTLPNKTGAPNMLFGNTAIGGLGQIKGLGENGPKFPPISVPGKPAKVYITAARFDNSLKSTDKQLGSGAFNRVFDNKDGTVTRILKNQGSKTDIQKDVLNQNQAARAGLAPKVISYSNNAIKMDKVAGVTISDAVKTATNKDINDIVKAKAVAAVQLHRLKIAHNDGHSENMFYDKDTKTAKFIDFGLSQQNADPRMIYFDYKAFYSSAIKVAFGKEFKTADEYQAFINSQDAGKTQSGLKLTRKL